MTSEIADKTPLGRVMLIDDDSFDQKIYQRVIKRTGLVGETVCFTLATEAVEYLKDSSNPRIDLILLDIRMPMMDGFEFLEAAQTFLGDGETPPVVMMLTTSLSPADRERSEASPVVRQFLNKPLTAEQVHGFVDVVTSDRAP